MAGNGRKNGAGGAVIDRALNAGLALAAASGRDADVEVLLTPAHEKMVTELCDVLGLSARSVLNAAVRYALHYARSQRVAWRRASPASSGAIYGQSMRQTPTNKPRAAARGLNCNLSDDSLN